MNTKRETTADRWQQLRTLRRIWLTSFPLVLLVFLLLYVFESYSSHPLFSLLTIALVATMLTFMISYLAALLWECPRCGKNYHINYPHSFFPIRQDCAHCGLQFGQQLNDDLPNKAL